MRSSSLFCKLIFTLVAVLIFLQSNSVSAKEVVVLLDPSVKPYVEVLAAYKSVVDAHVKVFERTEDLDNNDELNLIPAIKSRKPDLILAIGVEAMRVVSKNIADIPIVFCMVLSPLDKLTPWPKNLTGVSMNVPPRRQMNVLKQLLPNVSTVAVVYHPQQSASLIEQGRRAGKALNIELQAEAVTDSKEAIAVAESMFNQEIAYWMVPDQTMRSRDVVRYLFFAARDKERALIGLSDKYVRAGALFAFTIDYYAVGRQSAEMTNRLLSAKRIKIPPVEMARDINLSINSKVAEKLGITIPYELIRKAKVIY